MNRRGAALALMACLLAGCQNPDKHDSVWLVVTNDSGQNYRNVSFGAGRETFQYQLFDSGITQGGWVRVEKTQPLSLAYADETGARKQPELAPLEPGMTGGVYTVTLKPEGKVEQVFAAPSRPPKPRPWHERLELQALGALLVLVAGGGLLILASRAAQRLGARVKTAVTTALSDPSDPVRDSVKARLGLTLKICPVRMFTCDPEHPTQWWQGVFGGRMIGLLHEVVWLGDNDESTLLVFQKPKGASVFTVKDFTEGDSDALAADSELLGLLKRGSVAVTGLEVMADALQLHLDWKAAPAEALLDDIGLLEKMLDRVQALQPPLVMAVKRGDTEAVRALLAQKPDLEVQGLGRVTALLAAAWSGRADLVKLLLQAGAKAHPEFGFPLHAAAGLGHRDAVAALLDGGADVNALDAPGDTALMGAVTGGRRDVVELLLTKGANVVLKNLDGRSALSYVRGNAQIEARLRAAGAKD